MVRAALAGVVVVATLAAASGRVGAAGRIRLTIHDERVWLEASNTTIPEILAEWSRVAGTRIVNGDRIPGGPVTLQFAGVSEREALDVLLRAAGGFVAVPRREAAAAMASTFERILILPTRRAVSASAPIVAAAPVENTPNAAPAAATFVAPGVQRILDANGQPVPDDQDDAPSPSAASPFAPLPPGFAAAPPMKTKTPR